uniref:Plexin b2a, tandem duplicate 1 n=1 Tax=Fundulus heteroclitus TaxID=8078 RepID=A0A3Q2PA14_FUNHE
MMERWWAWQLTVVTMATFYVGPCQGRNPEFSSETLINNVVADPNTGRLYVGAVNRLYQLNSNLEVEFRNETGPKLDNQRCTPPISANCDNAVQTPNHNKLLLVHPEKNQLVVCGSLFKGLCSLKNLSNVNHETYFCDSHGEKSYVASTEEGVSVVGVMSWIKLPELPKNYTVFLVAKGYGSHDSTKLISTRILERVPEKDWVEFEIVADPVAIQSSTFNQEYLHNFRFAFKDNNFTYFVFSRRLSKQDKKNFTFISRMCENDSSYFSYTELQLNCSAGNKHNKVQAAFVGPAGKVLAQNLNISPAEKVLFATFTSEQEHTSAMCMYPLKLINEQIDKLREACYVNDGRIDNMVAVYSHYSSSKSECNVVTITTYDKNKCGAEYLPTPLVSTPEFALTAEPSLVHNSNMTAVAVAVEMEHSVAFLGTASGEVLKVHLSAHPEKYGRVSSEVTGYEVNKNLLFDSSLEHLYITTEKKITKVPVQTCHQKTDCHSCVSMKDPYCGWCVLEGKCTRKKDCSRSAETNTWLWSPNEQCVQITEITPPSSSYKKQKQVQITIPTLPRLSDHDKLECWFNSFRNDAVTVEENPQKVVCSLPEAKDIPPTRGQQDFVSVPVKVVLNKTIELTSGEYRFYNCSATVTKNPNTPCISCVNSPWGCQWSILGQSCSDQGEHVDVDHIVDPQQWESCPQFESPDKLLIPVGHPIPINFQGRNLDNYQDKSFSIGTELMKHAENVDKLSEDRFLFNGYEFAYDKQQEVNISFHIKEQGTERKIDSTLTVVLYNCSVGREDCSLCKSADSKYNCVWCRDTNTCVYEEICHTQEPPECPNPQIFDIIPRFGPLDGHIPVTIKGSNMGIKKEDVKKITVAGVDCVHLEDRYSVSTSVVCEIGSKTIPPHDVPPELTLNGPVTIELVDGREGRSDVIFTYRDPKPDSFHPTEGPIAGGTVITIRGENLDTATKEDVAIDIGGVPCEILLFGTDISCKTGSYSDQKVPPGKLTVTVKYGKKTSKALATLFEYRENPKISDYNPKASFASGGRRIVVEGKGFDLIQSATMKVLSSTDEPSVNNTLVEFATKASSKNDTTLVFYSPMVDCCNDSQSISTLLQLDNLKEELQDFNYHPDPHFDKLAKNVITETSIIIVTGRGFAKAITMQETQAFVGDQSCNVNILQDDKLILEAPNTTTKEKMELKVKFGNKTWSLGEVSYYDKKDDIPLAIIIPAVIVPMIIFIAVSVYCYRRKSQQAEREYEKVKHQLDSLEESVRDRCKKEFTDLMIEMEDHTSDMSDSRIPFLDYKTYTDRNFFLPSRESTNDPMITGKIQIPEARKSTVTQALNQFSNLLNSKTFLINFIHTLESRPDFNARSRGNFASLLTVALHGKLEYYTDIMRTLLLELMDEHVQSKNPKLMLRRSETVVERMLCNWMSICLYQFLRDTAGEPLYKLFKALKHQVEKGPVDAKLKKAKYTLNDTGLLGDDVEYSVLTLQVLVHGEGPDVTPVKVLNCDTITQVKEKIIDQVYRNLPYSQRPKAESVALEWRPGSTGQILSDLDLTSQKEGRWKRLNTLAHYNVRDNATLVLSRVLHTQSFHQHQDSHEEKNALLEEDNTFHLVRPTDELDEVKSKRGSLKAKATTKAITEIYLTRLLSVKGTLQQFVDDFFRSVLCTSSTVPPAVKYFFDFLDEQAERHDNVDEETLHIWKTNSLPMRFWVNILRNPHFILDVHLTEVVDASLHVIGQTFMDACTKTEHKLSRESPSNKLLYAKEISTYKKMVDDYYRGIRQMVPVSDQDMNTHLAEVSRQHTDKLNTQVALHQLYQYASKYFDLIIQSLDEDPAAQNRQLTLRLQQVAAALENKVTDL